MGRICLIGFIITV